MKTLLLIFGSAICIVCNSQTALEKYYAYVVYKNDTIRPKFDIHKTENHGKLKNIDGKHHYILNNKLHKIATYKKGQMNGQSILFNSDGNIKLISNYYENLMDGSWISFYPNGTIEHIECYCFGKKCGSWVYYNSDGTILKKEDW